MTDYGAIDARHITIENDTRTLKTLMFETNIYDSLNILDKLYVFMKSTRFFCKNTTLKTKAYCIIKRAF